jgi:hypothetical protein
MLLRDLRTHVNAEHTPDVSDVDCYEMLGGPDVEVVLIATVGQFQVAEALCAIATPTASLSRGSSVST